MKVINDYEGFKELLNTPEISLWLKWGSEFEGTLPFAKSKYVFSGSMNPMDFLTCLHEERKTWDKNILVVEEVKRLSSEVNVVHYAVKPPIFLMKSTAPRRCSTAL